MTSSSELDGCCCGGAVLADPSADASPSAALAAAWACALAALAAASASALAWSSCCLSVAMAARSCRRSASSDARDDSSEEMRCVCAHDGNGRQFQDTCRYTGEWGCGGEYGVQQTSNAREASRHGKRWTNENRDRQGKSPSARSKWQAIPRGYR
eukprot:2898935-Pleurochrysis_carterae.AAC.1